MAGQRSAEAGTEVAGAERGGGNAVGQRRQEKAVRTKKLQHNYRRKYIR